MKRVCIWNPQSGLRTHREPRGLSGPWRAQHSMRMEVTPLLEWHSGPANPAGGPCGSSSSHSSCDETTGANAGTSPAQHGCSATEGQTPRPTLPRLLSGCGGASETSPCPTSQLVRFLFRHGFLLQGAQNSEGDPHCLTPTLHSYDHPSP